MAESSAKSVDLLRVAAGLLFAAVGVAAVCNVAFGFDAHEHAHLVPRCLFKTVAGIDCPGCGITRSLMALSQLDLGAAVRMHPFGPLLLVAAGVYALAPRTRVVALGRRAAPVLLLVVLGLWLSRM